MGGWKTYAAGIGGILLGLGTAVQAAAAGDWGSVWQGVLILLAGLGTIGLGHKAEKIKAILEQFLPNRPPPSSPPPPRR
jgi:hypothetical protein